MVSGAIERVLVHDGDEVREGQPLVLLDRRRAEAEYKAARLRLTSLVLQRTRLQGQLAGFPTSALDTADVKWIGAAPDDVGRLRTLQNTLYRSAQDGMLTQIGSGVQEAESAQDEGRGLARVIEADRSKSRAIAAELDTARKLQHLHVGTLTKVRSLEGAAAEVDADLASAIVRQRKAENDAVAARLKTAEAQARFRESVAADLLTTSKEYIEVAARHAALGAELADLEIKAPVAGRVVGLTNQSGGSLVGAGEQLMTISPGETPRSIDARLPAEEIGSVSVASRVRFLLLSIDGQQYWSTGVVRYVSADRMTDKRTGVAYFDIKVQIADGALAARGLVRVGMTVKMVVENGSRTIVGFLIGPLMRRLDKSLI